MCHDLENKVRAYKGVKDASLASVCVWAHRVVVCNVRGRGERVTAWEMAKPKSLTPSYNLNLYFKLFHTAALLHVVSYHTDLG